MDPFQTKAYPIFVSEVRKHLAKLSEVFASVEVPPEEVLKESRIAAHRIKGGAGFFGLEDLGKSAANLEQLLLVPKISREHLSLVKQQLGNLSALADKMPEP